MSDDKETLRNRLFRQNEHDEAIQDWVNSDTGQIVLGVFGFLFIGAFLWYGFVR